MALNPNDNQGVRSSALKCYFDLNKYKEALKICNEYKQDVLAETQYGAVLALLKLGQLEKAAQALKKAAADLPLVAEEIIKKKHVAPESLRKGYISIGGADQAYDYWQDFGKYWGKPEIEFIRKHIEGNNLQK